MGLSESKNSEHNTDSGSLPDKRERSGLVMKLIVVGLSVILLVIALIFGIGYLKDQKLKKAELNEYAMVIEANTVEGYRAFLEKYPNSIYADEVSKKLAFLVAIEDAAALEEVVEEEDEKKPAYPFGIQMVYVSGGSFVMGCTSRKGSDCQGNELPAHKVSLSGFNIGKYEVTQRQWKAVMGVNPSNFKGCDDCPVENVSWSDVQKFISELNRQSGFKFRLPTEAEWEYAARGGRNTREYLFAGSDDINKVAWYSKNSGKKTHTVGKKRSNSLGIYDMSGNVSEWCNDWYSNTYYKESPERNPKGASSGSLRVCRGSNWRSDLSDGLLTHRKGFSPVSKYYYVGFRLAI